MKKLIKSRSTLTLFTMLFAIAISATVFLAVSNKKLSASSENPKIVFTEDYHDFGKVEAGPVLEYSFKFTNEGDKPLVIEKVQPSCGCTGATAGEKTEYNEGESGEIKITLNTEGRSGQQHKQVLVYTNDTAKSHIVLDFLCDVNNHNSN
jgi:hypothetical protein